MLRRNRIRWGRRVRLTFLWLAVPLAGVAAVRLAWGMIVERRLMEARRELAAAGVPETREELAGPVIAEERNAVIPLLHAIKGLSLTSPQRELLAASDKNGAPYRADYSPAELAQIDAVLGSMAPVFSDIDAATARPGARWPAEDFVPVDRWPTIHGVNPMNTLRFLANTAGLKARRDLAHHEDAACLHDILEILTISRVMDAGPDLVCHVMAGTERSLAAGVLEDFLPDLRFSSADDGQARALLAALADDQSFQRAQYIAFEAALIDLPESVASYRELSSWPLRPVAKNLLARWMASSVASLPAIASPTYNPALLPPSTGEGGGVLPIITFTSISDFFDKSEMSFHSRTLTDSRALAILLAVRLYEERQGKAPGSLGELAAILPPPADPFARDGAALRYRLDGAGPTVWSVGEDGIDSHAALVPPPAGSTERFRQVDLVYGAAWRAFSATLPKPLYP